MIFKFFVYSIFIAYVITHVDSCALNTAPLTKLERKIQPMLITPTFRS